MIELLSFASTYIYSPRGEGAVSIRSRTVRDRVKAANADAIQRYSIRVHELAVDHGVYPGFFGKDVVLVPVPGSSELVPGALWAPERIAQALVDQGLAAAVWPAVRRTTTVPKSAFAPAGERPTAERHHETLEVEPTLVAPARLVLVDDVVTKGRTLLAAATRLKETFPQSDVRAFAMIRTMGFLPDVEQILFPCVGEIRWQDGDAHRVP